MIKIFFKLKKKQTIFDPFPQFRGAKNIFPKNLAHIYWSSFLVQGRNSEKPNDPIARKQPSGK